MEPGLVRFLESRAQALRLPYSHTTPPQALLDAVLAREHADVAKRGIEALPACFGQLFAGPYNTDCDQCQVQAACMARFAWHQLPEVASDIGSDEPPALAEATELDAKAIVLAQTFALQASGREPAPFGGYTLIKPPVLPQVRCMADIPRPFALFAYASMLGAKAAMRVWHRDVRLVVNWAQPQVLGLTRTAFFKPPKKSPAWAARYTRERNRHPLYAKLKTGMLIRKVYDGLLHEVRVGWRCYEYEDQAYPTLYAVVQAIAGSIACPRPLETDGTRKPGTRHTAIRSPLIFFHRAFQQLVHRMPPKRKRRKKKAAG